MSHSATDLRTRIYGQYVKTLGERADGATAASLQGNAVTLVRLIRRHFPQNRNARIIDLGCGSGSLMYLARQAGYVNMTGVDRSPDQIRDAARLGITDIERGDAIEFLQQSPAGSADLLITFDVIEHLTRDEVLRLADLVHRTLAPEGEWLIHVPNGESPFYGRIRYGDFTHEQAFTRSSIRQLLLSSGFSGVTCYEDTPVVHGATSLVRWVLWKGVRGLLRLYLAIETGDTGRQAIFSQNLLAVAKK